jgi:PAS domain S-box-containing protein
MLDNIPDIAWLKDEKSRFIMVNRPFAAACGFTIEEIIGKTDLDIWPKKLAERYRRDDREVIKGCRTKRIEEPLVFKNGKAQWIETIKTPIFNEKGKPIGTVGIARDITERKSAEQELRESEARYKALFTGAPEGMLVADLQTKEFRYANPAICRMLGYTKEELLRRGVVDIHPKESLGHVLVEFKSLARNEKSLTFDIPCLRNDGTIFHANVSSIVMVLDGRKCILGIFTDITERMRAEAKLKEFERKLREDNLLLEQKNSALKELVDHTERVKNKTKEDIAINVEEFITPILRKMKIKDAPVKYIKLLEHHLKELTSSFGCTITQRSARLTSREIEICGMIKGGLESKEISELLNVSYQTIDKHRRHIRKKLGISGKKINLTSFLQNL